MFDNTLLPKSLLLNFPPAKKPILLQKIISQYPYFIPFSKTQVPVSLLVLQSGLAAADKSAFTDKVKILVRRLQRKMRKHIECEQNGIELALLAVDNEEDEDKEGDRVEFEKKEYYFQAIGEGISEAGLFGLLGEYNMVGICVSVFLLSSVDHGKT